MNKSISTSTVN